MYKFIPGLNELTSDSSVAKLRVSVLRPLNRYSRSLDRSTMYVPTVPQRPKLSPGERERKKEISASGMPDAYPTRGETLVLVVEVPNVTLNRRR
jgi:hypothetical protein